jgi:hypothetical protein
MAQIRRYTRLEILKYRLLAIWQAERPIRMVGTMLEIYWLETKMLIRSRPWSPTYWRSRRLFKQKLAEYRSTHT